MKQRQILAEYTLVREVHTRCPECGAAHTASRTFYLYQLTERPYTPQERYDHLAGQARAWKPEVACECGAQVRFARDTTGGTGEEVTA